MFLSNDFLSLEYIFCSSVVFGIRNGKFISVILLGCSKEGKNLVIFILIVNFLVI